MKIPHFPYPSIALWILFALTISFVEPVMLYSYPDGPFLKPSSDISEDSTVPSTIPFGLSWLRALFSPSPSLPSIVSSLTAVNRLLLSSATHHGRYVSPYSSNLPPFWLKLPALKCLHCSLFLEAYIIVHLFFLSPPTFDLLMTICIVSTGPW